MAEEETMNKLVAIVGMTGSGKTEAADYLGKKGFHFLRMGQITLDEVKKRGLAPTEENERPIREEFRRVHGMGAFAILNLQRIDLLLKQGNVVIDNLMSWEEYKVFEEKYKESFFCIAIIASPKVRYARLAGRKYDPVKDPKMRHREATYEQARSRDFAEIEKIDKGGPIAMAHFAIINEGAREELFVHLDRLLSVISAGS
jgi:dephospho-CoA kinase